MKKSQNYSLTVSKVMLTASLQLMMFLTVIGCLVIQI